MSDNPSLPKARGPTIIAARAVEEGMEALDFRSNSGQGPAPVPQPPNSERRPDKAASLVDEQVRVGRVMKALFPDGIQIADEEQFATMRLFNAMVASIAQFSQSNMSNPVPMRDVSRQAEMLDEMLRRRARGNQP